METKSEEFKSSLDLLKLEIEESIFNKNFGALDK